MQKGSSDTRDNACLPRQLNTVFVSETDLINQVQKPRGAAVLTGLAVLDVSSSV